MLLVRHLLLGLLSFASTYSLPRALDPGSDHEGVLPVEKDIHRYWTPARIPYDQRSESFRDFSPTDWKRAQNVKTILHGLGRADLKARLEDWFTCMERRAALLDPPVRVPGAHQAPSQAFLQEELSVEDMERMGRLADMCLHVVRDGYEAIRARTDDLILRDQEAQRRGETSEGGKDLPTLDDRQAEIKRREEKAFTGGGFNAFMSRVGKILPKGPNAQSFAAFGTAAIGGFMRVPTVL